MSATRLSPSRRREDIRAWWAAHMKAQQDSGQSQVAYCRAKGLDPKYFTLSIPTLVRELAALRC